MNARPLRWWSASALAAVAGPIETAWRDWCADWELASGPVVATNASESGTVPHEPTAWIRPASGGQPGLWLRADGTDIGAGLSGLLFGSLTHGAVPAEEAVRPSGRSLAGEVAALALEDLSRALAAACTLSSPGRLYGPSIVAPDSEAEAKPPPRADWRAWSGAITFELKCAAPATFRLVGHLQPADAEQLTAARHPTMTSAAGVQSQPRSKLQAISEQPVRLSIQLAELSLDLGTLQSLRDGDVLILPHELDRPLQVRAVATGSSAAAGDSLCVAYLGSRGGRRAVELARAPTLV